MKTTKNYIELVEKHYIHKDSTFYDVYLKMMQNVTTLYNICVWIERSRIKYEESCLKEYSKTHTEEETQEYLKVLRKDKNGLLTAYDLDKTINKIEAIRDYYSLLVPNSAQIVTQEVSSAFKFIETHRRNGRGYMKYPHFRKYDTKSVFSLVSSNFKQVNNRLEIIPKKLESSNGSRLSIRVHGHKRGDFISYQQIKFKYYKDRIIVYVLYRVAVKDIKSDNKRYMSIDLGIHNYACITNNVGERPIIISGSSLVGRLKRSTYKISILQSHLSKQNIKLEKLMMNATQKQQKSTKQIERIQENLKHFKDSFEHHVSNYIISYALKHEYKYNHSRI